MSIGIAIAPSCARGAPRVLVAAVSDLLALSLLAKHVHWNVVGPRFSPLHALFDEMASYFLEAADLAAERLRALGFPVDARLRSLSASPDLPEPPPGLLRDADAIAQGIAAVDLVAKRIRDRLDKGDPEEAVSYDLVVGILERLNHFVWMLRAQS